MKMDHPIGRERSHEIACGTKVKKTTNQLQENLMSNKY